MNCAHNARQQEHTLRPSDSNREENVARRRMEPQIDGRTIAWRWLCYGAPAASGQ